MAIAEKPQELRKKAMKLFKNITTTFMLITIIVTMNGCTHVDNKSWDDMTPVEQKDARDAYEDVKNDLEEEFSGDTVEDKFVEHILDKVEQGIDYED